MLIYRQRCNIVGVLEKNVDGSHGGSGAENNEGVLCENNFIILNKVSSDLYTKNTHYFIEKKSAKYVKTDLD